MYRYISAMLVAIVMLAACRPAPQPAPTEPPAVPAGPTAVAASSSIPTLAAPPTATSVPTTAPTAAPTQPTPVPALRVQVNSPDVGFVNVRDAPATSGTLVAQAKDGATLD